nr:hypothetical protein [Tanacetum cinerariifolium]
MFHPDQSSPIAHKQHPQPNNNFVQQPSFNTNYMPQPMQNIKDSSDPRTTMNKALALVAKAFKINNIPTNNNQRSSVIPRKSQIAQLGMNSSQDIKMQMVAKNIRNQKFQISMVMEMLLQHRLRGNGSGINGNPIRCYNCRGEGHYASNCIVKPRKWDAAYLQQQLQIAQEEEAGIQSTQEESYNDMKQKIEWLQAQLGDLKGKSSDTQYASNTLDLVSQKLEDENVPLEFQVSEPKGTTKGTRTNTRFTKQSILGKLPSSSYKPKLYSVTLFPKSLVLPKVDKTNALSKPFILNSAPSTRELKVIQTVNMITPRIFRVNNTAKTRRPHLRSNSNNDRVLSKSKSSCLSNNIEKIEENHRNS